MVWAQVAHETAFKISGGGGCLRPAQGWTSCFEALSLLRGSTGCAQKPAPRHRSARSCEMLFPEASGRTMSWAAAAVTLTLEVASPCSAQFRGHHGSVYTTAFILGVRNMRQVIIVLEARR